MMADQSAKHLGSVDPTAKSWLFRRLDVHAGEDCHLNNSVVHTGTMSTLSDIYSVHITRTVKSIVLLGRTGMHKTGCSGETRTVLHIPSSS